MNEQVVYAVVVLTVAAAPPHPPPNSIQPSTFTNTSSFVFRKATASVQRDFVSDFEHDLSVGILTLFYPVGVLDSATKQLIALGRAVTTCGEGFWYFVSVNRRKWLPETP